MPTPYATTAVQSQSVICSVECLPPPHPPKPFTMMSCFKDEDHSITSVDAAGIYILYYFIFGGYSTFHREI